MLKQHSNTTHKTVPRKKFTLIATTFDRKGAVIATGQNEYTRSHPLQKYFSVKAGESEHKHWKHAELSAILQSKNKQIHSIFVQRFAADGSQALAKPCLSCQEAIKAFGIKKVYYTTPEGVKNYYV